MVSSPAFTGAEPVFTTSGKHKGNTFFQKEQNLGLELMQSLSAEQQEKAIIGPKESENIIAAAYSDNVIVDYAGIKVSELSVEQKAQLLDLIAEYVSNMPDGHAAIRMDEVKAHLDNSWFAWRGTVLNDSIFYYRVQSPVILIEFDHQGPVGVKSPDGSRDATRNHIHTMLRTPNGNDYGKDLLRQHLEAQH